MPRAVRGGSQRLRLVQGTAAGVDEQVQAAGLSADELERVAVTSASGVHAGPLAEFALMGLLFARGLPRLEADRSAHRWDHYVTPEFAERTLVVLGSGSIGAQVLRLAKVFGATVIGVNTSGKMPDAPSTSR